VPFTPFHFGPGALVSVATPKYVSFLSFCAVNVLIDVESLYNMVTGQPRIHTFLHTYIGASLAAIATVVIFLFARWLATRTLDGLLLRWVDIRRTPVVIGALVGAWSHVVLDSIMHADITPLAPFTSRNDLYQLIPLTTLHGLCVAAAAIAIVWLALRDKKSP
jgi:hypothetical protein